MTGVSRRRWSSSTCTSTSPSEASTTRAPRRRHSSAAGSPTRYLECALTQAASLRLQELDCELVLATNIGDRARAGAQRRRAARAASRRSACGSCPPSTATGRARAPRIYVSSRYVLDAILTASEGQPAERELWLTDLDCVWADPELVFATRAEPPSEIGCVYIDYPPDWDTVGFEAHGRTRRAIGELARTMGGAEEVPPWVGGELLPGRPERCASSSAPARSSTRGSPGRRTLPTEEQILSLAGATRASALPRPLGGRQAHDDRPAQPGAASVEDPLSIGLWHLPSEKGLSLRRAAARSRAGAPRACGATSPSRRARRGASTSPGRGCCAACATTAGSPRSALQQRDRARRSSRATAAPDAARRAKRLRSGRADDQHRAGRVVGDLVRHRAEQEALGAGHALVADHDQVGFPLLGDVEDRVRGIALTRVHVDRHAGLAADRRGRLERRVDVLARVDRPLQVLGRLRGVPRSGAAPGTGSYALTSSSLAPDGAREVDGLAHGLVGRVRAVGSHHDRFEHHCSLASRHRIASPARSARRSYPRRHALSAIDPARALRRSTHGCVLFASRMIDLHCHVLPGIDDGPDTIEGSVALARAARAAGIDTLVATPHVNARNPNDRDTIARLVRGRSTRACRRRESSSRSCRAPRSRSATSARSSRRSSRAWGSAGAVAAGGAAVHAGRDRPGGPSCWACSDGAIGVVLAHPERCPAFQRDRQIVRSLVDGRRADVDHRRLARRALRRRGAPLRAGAGATRA